MKMDIDALARAAAGLAGLRPEQIPGLALLFGMVAREAFCEGVRLGRKSLYGADPMELHDLYARDAGKPEPTPAAEPTPAPEPEEPTTGAEL